MKSYCLALAAIAAMGFPGVAYAGDTKPTPMTDAQMDKVTAGVEGADHLIIQSNSQVFHVNGKDSAHSITNGWSQFERNTIQNPGTTKTVGPCGFPC